MKRRRLVFLLIGLVWLAAIVLLTRPALAASPDLDGGGVVGPSDLAIVIASFHTDAGGDLDGDGDTDAGDLAIVTAAWGARYVYSRVPVGAAPPVGVAVADVMLVIDRGWGVGLGLASGAVIEAHGSAVWWVLTLADAGWTGEALLAATAVRALRAGDAATPPAAPAPFWRLDLADGEVVTDG